MRPKLMNNRRVARHGFGRRGVASVLAMLYLVLFGTLAVGFYAAVTTSAQVAGGDQAGALAMYAADSGMQFICLQLAKGINVPHGTPADKIFSEIYDDLVNKLEGTPNMGTMTVGGVGDTIYVPAPNVDGSLNWIVANKVGNDAGGRFRATIQQLSDNHMRVKVWGRHVNASIVRCIQMDYGIAQNASQIFDYGVASKAAISMNGNATVKGPAGNPSQGSVLAATASNVPLTMTGSPSISGDFSYTNPTGSPQYANGTVDGYQSSSGNFASHVHGGVTMPEWPTVDTSSFKTYATNVYPATGSGNANILTNVLMPPGTYSFNNATINGVLVIQTPCSLTFSGSTTVNGAIVVDTTVALKGTSATNLVKFGGGITASPINCPANVTLGLPAGELALTNTFVLIPGCSLDIGGNFNTVSGSFIADSMNFHGSTGGTIIGSVINLQDTSVAINTNNPITIQSAGTNQYPAGLFFGQHYVPLADTYQEVLP